MPSIMRKISIGSRLGMRGVEDLQKRWRKCRLLITKGLAITNFSSFRNRLHCFKNRRQQGELMMKINAHAKINLALDIVGKNETGMHDLETIMAPIELHDVISISSQIDSSDIKIKVTNNNVPVDEKNTVYQTCRMMQDIFNLREGFSIAIQKNIPIEAGLGGGSADAAAVLHAINKICRLSLSKQQMMSIAKKISWDVPFCLYNRLSYIYLSSTNIRFIDVPLPYHILLVKPTFGVQTKQAFQEINLPLLKHPNCATLAKKLEIKDSSLSAELFGNSFLSISYLNQEYNKIKDLVSAIEFEAISLTGTGACFFLLSRDYSKIERGEKILSKEYPYVKKTSFYNGCTE